MQTALPALDDRVFVSGQIAPGDIKALADRGVRLIVNHRPDGEEPGQVASGILEREAEAAGVAYVHAPVSGMPSNAAVEATAEALALLAPGATALFFCKSGMRSSATWALAERDRGMDTETLKRQAANAGYDLSRLPL